MMKFEVIGFDYIGDPGGFAGFDSYRTDLFINIEVFDSDKEILKKLKEVGFLKKTAKYKCFEIEARPSDDSLYINHVSAKNGFIPFCELRKVDK